MTKKYIRIVGVSSDTSKGGMLRSFLKKIIVNMPGDRAELLGQLMRLSPVAPGSVSEESLEFPLQFLNVKGKITIKRIPGGSSADFIMEIGDFLSDEDHDMEVLKAIFRIAVDEFDEFSVKVWDRE